MNAPLLISGPSGVGKSYLAKHLQLNYNCRRIIPITTRNKRSKERHGIDYQFLTDEEYQRLVDDNALFMNNEMFGARYGFSNYSVDKIIEGGQTPMAEIYTPKIIQFVESYPDSNRIFLLPSSEEFLVQRMKERGESDENIEKRIYESKQEVRMFVESYQYLYNTVYKVEEIKFTEMVHDIVNNYITEGQIQGERVNKFVLR